MPVAHLMATGLRPVETEANQQRPEGLAAVSGGPIDALARPFVDPARQNAAAGDLDRALGDATRIEARRLAGALDAGLRALI